ncbi:MAG TPA: AsmA family protein [Thermodesulfovibrionales bacterium]|nr:AsmA family protein [Thermodesulfovibrionales bacterium]
MKKKFVWAAAIFIGLVFVLFLGLSILVRTYLKSETLKSLIIPRVEQATGRKLNINEIQVSLFRGIVVKGIMLKEHDGNKDFIKADEFVLDYQLWPLLRKQLVIRRVELISPTIFVRREKDGTYNFSDLTGKKVGTAKTAPMPETEKGKGLPLSISADRIDIRNARLEFTDSEKTIPDIVADADAGLKLSLGTDMKEMKASGFLNLKNMQATLNGIQTNTSGKIEASNEEASIKLTTLAGKESIKIEGNVKDYLKSPDITLNISARELTLDRIIPAGSGKKSDMQVVKGKETASGKGEKGREEQAPKIKAAGEIRLETAHYKGYAIKDFRTNYRYSGGVMTIDPVMMHFSGGEGVKTEGSFKGNFRFSGNSKDADAASTIKKTLTGKGLLDLSRCEVKSSALMDAMSVITGLSELKSPHFENSQFRFTVNNQKINLEGTLNSSQLNLNPSGTIGFDERIDVIADLKISPALGSRLPTARITGYMKDEKGWTTIPLKITGTVDKPLVKLNSAAMEKVFERGIKGEIEKQLLKEPSNKEKQPSKPQDLLKGIFGR